MSQKYIKTQNKNRDSAAYGKYYAMAVYDSKFITTEELASFIQTQASVKKSDIKAVLDELGEAMKHFFELGQKIKLDGIDIFKVGFSSIGVNKVGGLHLGHDHNPPRAVPARDGARGSRPGEED